MTAEELYAAALRGAISLVERQTARSPRRPGEPKLDDLAAPFATALREWEATRDVERHLRAYGGMGSLSDWGLGYWDASLRSYEIDHWPNACFDSLRGAIVAAGNLIRDGSGAEKIAVPEKRFDFWGEDHTRCSNCGYELMWQREVDALAALLWRELIADRAIRRGDVDAVVDAALAGPADEECHRFVSDVEDAFAHHQIAIVGNDFRRDHPCPRCGANEWGRHFWHVTAPPLRLAEGMDPFTWLAQRRRRNGDD